MKVRLRLFSVARDIAGFDEQMIDLPTGQDAGAALQVLLDHHPALKVWRSSLRLAVNCEYVDPSRALQEGDEVAVIPPVSGG